MLRVAWVSVVNVTAHCTSFVLFVSGSRTGRPAGSLPPLLKSTHFPTFCLRIC